MTLVEFLAARLDEDEARAHAMLDAVWPAEVWVQPRTDTGDAPQGCVSVRHDGPKAYLRIWDGGEVEHGWTVPASAAPVWSAEVARAELAEVDAKRRIVDEWRRGDSDEMRETAWLPRLLALPYADHADYREEWRPSA